MHFQIFSAFVDAGDGTKKLDPMLSCRVVVIKWVAQYTHLTRSNSGGNSNALLAMNNISVSVSTGLNSPSANAVNGQGDDTDTST